MLASTSALLAVRADMRVAHFSMWRLGWAPAPRNACRISKARAGFARMTATAAALSGVNLVQGQC
jgi:hypothetical protein